MKLVRFDVEVALGEFRLVARGELGEGLHCVVGPNGSGKTTLLKTLAGAIRPARGRVEYIGVERPVYLGGVEVPAAARALDVALLGRSRELWPPTRRDLEAVEEAAKALGIDWALRRRWAQLSDGQRQRILLTAALAAGADLLALDEPTRALDPAARAEVFATLRRVARGRIVVAATHDLDMLKCCDTVIGVRNGEIAFVAKPGEGAEELVRSLYAGPTECSKA